MPYRSILLPVLQSFSRTEEPLLSVLGGAPDVQHVMSLLSQPENLVPRMAEGGPATVGRVAQRPAASFTKPAAR